MFKRGPLMMALFFLLLYVDDKLISNNHLHDVNELSCGAELWLDL